MGASTSSRIRPRLRPRWHKVLSDLWGNRVRSLLVVASIGVGLFAIGMIITIQAILTTDMRASYAAVNPANITIAAANFDDDTVDLVAGVAGVQRAEGVRSFDVQARDKEGRWTRISIKAIPDFDQMQINRVSLEQGSWPPGKHEMVLEQNKRGELPPALGGDVTLSLPSGDTRQIKLVGVVHDLTLGAAALGGGFFLAPVQGYISTDTLAWLGQPDTYNTLYATVQTQPNEEAHLRQVANRVSDAMEANDRLVYNAYVRGSRDHPNASYTDAMAGVLFMLGGLVVFLSAFLITNTLSALLNQQSQQIAIMKTVGARSFQVVGIYIALIFLFGLLALLISLPLSQQAAFRLLAYLSQKVNFNVVRYRSIPLAVLLQVMIALLVPQIAGMLPILRGASLKVQEGFSGSLVEQPARSGMLDTQHGWLVRGRRISRPLLISLRNTFRRKGRLALTLLTLTLGGAIFIATFNVRASLETYIAQLSRYFVADVNLTLDRSYRLHEIDEAVRQTPGVLKAEGWAYARSELLFENPSQPGVYQAGDAVQLLAPPSDTRLIDPILLAGRWLRPGDQNAIALSERFLSRFPSMKPGDTLRLRVNGKETDWLVVGFFQLAGKSAGFIAYTNYEYLSELIDQPNQAATYRITASRPNLSIEEQRQLAAQIEDSLQNQGISVTEASAGQSLLVNSTDGLNILTTFLLIMAVLTALVGSIGLMGTMSMNVLDRTREIGVMRAIGASDRAITNLVIVEGVLIGLISWVIGTLAAIPISKVMSDVVSRAIFDAPAKFTFTLLGPAAWLVLVLLLSILASVAPARNAARITIREALAYE